MHLEKRVSSFGAGISIGCEVPELEAMSQTQVFCKSSKHC